MIPISRRISFSENPIYDIKETEDQLNNGKIVRFVAINSANRFGSREVETKVAIFLGCMPKGEAPARRKGWHLTFDSKGRKQPAVIIDFPNGYLEGKEDPRRVAATSRRIAALIVFGTLPAFDILACRRVGCHTVQRLDR